MDSALKKMIPSGGVLSAPSTVRKSVKVVSKKLVPTQTKSHTVVKCVLKGTDPESKAIASKCKYYSFFFMITEVNNFFNCECFFQNL